MHDLLGRICKHELRVANCKLCSKTEQFAMYEMRSVFGAVKEVSLDLRIPEPRCLFCLDGDALDEPHVCKLTKFSPMVSLFANEEGALHAAAYLDYRANDLLRTANIDTAAFAVGAIVWSALVQQATSRSTVLVQGPGAPTLEVMGRRVHKLRAGFHYNLVVPLCPATYRAAKQEVERGSPLRLWDAATPAAAPPAMTQQKPVGCPFCFETNSQHTCTATNLYPMAKICLVGESPLEMLKRMARPHKAGEVVAIAVGSALYEAARLVRYFDVANVHLIRLREMFHPDLAIALTRSAYEDAKRMASEQSPTRFWDANAADFRTIVERIVKAPGKVVGYRDGAVSVNGIAFPQTPPIVAAPPRPQYDVPLTIDGKAADSISFEANPRVWQRAVDAAYCPPDLNRDAFRAVLIGMPESHMSLSTAEASIAWTIAAIQQRRDCDVYRRYCRALAAPRPPAGPWLARRSARR